jgi:hypothetical protein
VRQESCSHSARRERDDGGGEEQDTACRGLIYSAEAFPCDQRIERM